MAVRSHRDWSCGVQTPDPHSSALRFGLFRHRALLIQLIKRDVLLRYRGAMFGVLWMFLSPLLMLGIFAFIFGQIFQTRWPQQPEGLPFWLMLYSGLIVFNLYADAVSRSPSAVRGYPSYVKKIIFPVEVLALVPLGSSIIHALFNLLIFAVALAWVGHLSIGLLLFPVLLLPVLLLALGLSWFLAAWGVFIKDMTQIVPLVVQMTLFLSPVFYPVSAVPAWLQPLYRYNPIGSVIEAGRTAILGSPIPWAAWLTALGVGAVICALGYLFFQRSRDEFADVL
ncbi:MAG: ABC transporter permease [Chromatiaceae bacterium]|nr:ABC transporter permease [Chromatiaceae bacterium]